ncbi:amino acid permease [Williamsia sterculiae]|uniref:Gamma-aminobutyrate:proton symporter, AAT family n=1 Tax=Williamsia sterculiae TaxID=1344003 RepID=A0A1N7EPZ5_9NOCA|nr:amino acid permease [Williamsia sterculiae]SIR90158.1 gamma-aminobutyrate:proton symporter, AAT family [Williamsia sterculiae]
MSDSDVAASDAELGKGLRRRHMNLIALGGVIGAGLFVGSGVVIADAGPAAVVSFLIGGLITMLIMRMLAEMAVAQPVVGSFYVYARRALGRRGGFVTGWLYWYFFVVVVAVEAVAGGRIVQLWLPEVPLWVLSLVLMLTLTATNLVSARSFGEFEYWFSSIKVVAIVVFLFVGILWITGLWPDSTPGLSNLVDHGGFTPSGWGAVLAAVVPCVAFYTGAEIVTIAAAESDEPEQAVSRAMRSIILRIILFYVGSILVVVTVQPWNTKSVGVSPYASVLSVLGIPAVSTIMNLIVLTAVLSCLNSALYTTSRMVFALTTHGDGPRFFTRLSANGVPRRAILLGTVVGYVSVAATYIWGDVVFDFLVNSYGAVALFVYLIIAVSQVVLRRRVERQDPTALRLKMWLFPWLSYATIAVMVAVILAMAFLPSTRSQFIMSGVTLVVILVAYELTRWRSRRSGTDEVIDPDASRTVATASTETTS